MIKKWHLIVADVVCTGDEFALLEQDIGFPNLNQQRRLFGNSGLHLSEHEEIKLRTTAQNSSARIIKCTYSPTAAKLNKYNAYKKHCAVQHGYSGCEIMPLVFGVRGFVPTATYTFLTKLTGPKITAKLAVTKQLLARILHIVFRAIVVIYNAWASVVPPA